MQYPDYGGADYDYNSSGSVFSFLDRSFPGGLNALFTPITYYFGDSTTLLNPGIDQPSNGFIDSAFDNPFAPARSFPSMFGNIPSSSTTPFSFSGPPRINQSEMDEFVNMYVELKRQEFLRRQSNTGGGGSDGGGSSRSGKKTGWVTLDNGAQVNSQVGSASGLEGSTQIAISTPSLSSSEAKKFIDAGFKAFGAKGGDSIGDRSVKRQGVKGDVATNVFVIDLAKTSISKINSLLGSNTIVTGIKGGKLEEGSAKNVGSNGGSKFRGAKNDGNYILFGTGDDNMEFKGGKENLTTKKGGGKDTMGIIIGKGSSPDVKKIGGGGGDTAGIQFQVRRS